MPLLNRSAVAIRQAPRNKAFINFRRRGSVELAMLLLMLAMVVVMGRLTYVYVAVMPEQEAVKTVDTINRAAWIYMGKMGAKPGAELLPATLTDAGFTDEIVLKSPELTVRGQKIVMLQRVPQPGSPYCAVLLKNGKFYPDISSNDPLRAEFQSAH